MPYMQDGYPAELANKVGHIKLIEDPMIQGMIEAFEDVRPAATGTYPPVTGHVDMDGECSLNQVIVVDGGHQVVPNAVRPERQVGFVQVAAVLLEISTLDAMRANPMMDPRDVRQMLGRYTHHTHAALPLAGVHLPNLSVRQSIRQAVHGYFRHYELYEALSYLVYREWETSLSPPPFMDCLRCASRVDLPHGSVQFRCPSCGEEHTLSDYLGLCSQGAEDRPRLEVISDLRAVLEALVLFSFIIRFRFNKAIMSRTLFLLDGPLLLRAELSRLVEPIRALIVDQVARGLPLNLVGVEKSGEFRAFADAYAPELQRPGDFFLPSTEFVVEEINGRAYAEETYRNRVNYGVKVVLRAGRDHVLAMNVPTGEYLTEPKPADLIGFEDTVRLLSQLSCYEFENALIPVVLANSEASISNQPSGSILAQFIERILHPSRGT